MMVPLVPDNIPVVADPSVDSTQPQRMLFLLTALGGSLLVAPLFGMGKVQPWFVVLALVLLMPYAVVGWRLLRTPRAKEGPGLALGIGLTIALPALLPLASVIGGRSDYPRMAYFSALVLIHLLLIAFAIPAFRRGTSSKPVWRVLLRSILDPAVYYGIVFFLAAGARLHH